MADESASPPPPTDPTDATAPLPNPTQADPVAELNAANDALKNVDADLASAQASIDDLLKQANFEDPSALPGSAQALPTQGFDLPDFQQVMADAQVSSIDLLRDV